MNASRPIFFPASTLRASDVGRRARGLLAAASIVTLSGCTALPISNTQIDPTSPVAAEAGMLTRQAKTFPKFASIPKTPTDIRPLRRYGQQASAVLAAGDALVAETAPGTWTLEGTDAFANRARQDVGPEIAPPNAGDAEAFARSLRERATPPPPR